MSKQRETKRWARNGQLAEYLNVTKMTIWRWQRDPDLAFPQPAVINAINYTDLDQVDEWMKARVVNRIERAA